MREKEDPIGLIFVLNKHRFYQVAIPIVTDTLKWINFLKEVDDFRKQKKFWNLTLIFAL